MLIMVMRERVSQREITRFCSKPHFISLKNTCSIFGCGYHKEISILNGHSMKELQ